MNSLIEQQFADLKSKFDKLELRQDAGGGHIVVGEIAFTVPFGGEYHQDSFQIEILIPASYPAISPKAKECGGRIPDSFHKHADKSLCLAAAIEVKRIFNQKQTLRWYVEKLVIPYLFQFSYHEKHGTMPLGELSHGITGTIEYYTDLFQVQDDLTALSLLKILAEDTYRGHHLCPCNSGNILRKCHGPLLREIQSLEPHAYFVAEYTECIIKTKEKQKIPNYLRSDIILRQINKLFGKSKK